MGEDSFEMRVMELRENGLDFSRANKKAQLERNIENWPSVWGNNFLVVIYGDFKSPSEDIVLPALGITIKQGNKRKEKFKSAACVLDVFVKVNEKSEFAVRDGLSRLNIFLGMWVLSSGCSACCWFSSLVHGMIQPGAGYADMDIRNLDSGCHIVLDLSSRVRQKVCAALYWIRAPRNISMDYRPYGNDLLSVYSGYWNAFECLVDAINEIKPQPRLSKSKKQKLIDEVSTKRSGRLTIEDIANCYHEIVNPGFRGTAIHALRVCFPNEADQYIKECFQMPKENDRLYKIRNAIDHGDIDAENYDELMRVEWRLSQLQSIVYGMLSWILKQADATRSETRNLRDA